MKKYLTALETMEACIKEIVDYFVYHDIPLRIKKDMVDKLRDVHKAMSEVKDG